MVKQDCIAVKFCEKTEKRLNFHKVKKKKKEKFRVVSTIIARSEQLYLAASGRFSHSGSHIPTFERLYRDLIIYPEWSLFS